jgi:asparagine N-glycosylation enzyme membrane subunit Stt3
MWRIIWISILSLALAIIQPFAPFAVYAIIGVTLLLIWRRDRSFPRASFLTAFIAGLITAPLLLYMYLATQNDPALRAWSIQNQTPSPPVIDYLIGYGLLLIAAIPAARSAWRRGSNWDLLFLVWIVVTVPMLYAPIPLQRRLSLGLHIPIALLAAQGLSQVIRSKWPRRLAMAAMLPTSVFIMLALIGGAVVHDPHIYITSNEAAAIDWLQANARSDDIVLAAPETGAFIPAFAGQRVVYGHPYETVEADRKRQLVDNFFAGKTDRVTLLRDTPINYVLIGPRERRLGSVDPALLPIHAVFTSGDVILYAVNP